MLHTPEPRDALAWTPAQTRVHYQTQGAVARAHNWTSDKEAQALIGEAVERANDDVCDIIEKLEAIRTAIIDEELIAIDGDDWETIDEINDAPDAHNLVFAAIGGVA